MIVAVHMWEIDYKCEIEPILFVKNCHPKHAVYNAQL